MEEETEGMQDTKETRPSKPAWPMRNMTDAHAEGQAHNACTALHHRRSRSYKGNGLRRPPLTQKPWPDMNTCKWADSQRKTSSSVSLSHNDVLGFSFLVFVLFYCSCLLILTYFYFICLFFLFLPYRSFVNKLWLSVSVFYGILECVKEWVFFFCLLLGSYPSVCFVQFQCVRFCFILLYFIIFYF